jgi:hypothetical protein
MAHADDPIVVAYEELRTYMLGLAARGRLKRFLTDEDRDYLRAQDAKLGLSDVTEQMRLIFGPDGEAIGSTVTLGLASIRAIADNYSRRTRLARYMTPADDAQVTVACGFIPASIANYYTYLYGPGADDTPPVPTDTEKPTKPADFAVAIVGGVPHITSRGSIDNVSVVGYVVERINPSDSSVLAELSTPGFPLDDPGAVQTTDHAVLYQAYAVDAVGLRSDRTAAIAVTVPGTGTVDQHAPPQPTGLIKVATWGSPLGWLVQQPRVADATPGGGEAVSGTSSYAFRNFGAALGDMPEPVVLTAEADYNLGGAQGSDSGSTIAMTTGGSHFGTQDTVYLRGRFVRGDFSQQINVTAVTSSIDANNGAIGIEVRNSADRGAAFIAALHTTTAGSINKLRVYARLTNNSTPQLLADLSVAVACALKIVRVALTRFEVFYATNPSSPTWVSCATAELPFSTDVLACRMAYNGQGTYTGYALTLATDVSYYDVGAERENFSITTVATDHAGFSSDESAVRTFTLPALTSSGDPFTFRVNIGGPTYTDPGGLNWLADTGVLSPTSYVNDSGATITGSDAARQPLYQTSRWDIPTLVVDAAVPADDTYTINLYFADPVFGTAGHRVFNVEMNGTVKETGVDIGGVVGSNATLKKSYTHHISTGSLHLRLIGTSDNGLLCALEIIQGGETADLTAPTVPTNLSAQALSQSATRLQWSASSDAGTGVGGYKVFKDGSYLATTTSTTYDVTGMAAGEVHSYRVSAFDQADPVNESAQSAAVTGVTLDPPISQPSNKIIFRFPTNNAAQWAQIYQMPAGSVVFCIFDADNYYYDSYSNPNPQLQAHIDQCHIRGIKVLGHVTSLDVTGTIPYQMLTRAQLKTRIDAWYNAFPNIDGIFFGQGGQGRPNMPEDLTWVQHWTEMTAYVRSKQGGTTPSPTPPPTSTTFPGLNHPYPRIAGGFTGTNQVPDATQRAIAAKFHIIEIGGNYPAAYPNGEGMTRQQAYDDIKSRSLVGTKIVQYGNFNERRADGGAYVQDWKNAVVAANWDLWQVGRSGTHVISGWDIPNFWLINPTHFVGQYGGLWPYQYAAFATNRCYITGGGADPAASKATSIDYFLCDNVFSYTNPGTYYSQTYDYNPTGGAWTQADFRAGESDWFTYGRTINPNKGWGCNGYATWNNGAPDPNNWTHLMNMADFAMLENGLGPNGSEATDGTLTFLARYKWAVDASLTAADRPLKVDARDLPTSGNLREARYAQCVVLMGPGYFGTTTSAGPPANQFYDEMYGGAINRAGWLGSALEGFQTASRLGNGVLHRDFVSGRAWLNPRGNGAKVIDLTDFQRLTHNSALIGDAAINNGAIGGSYTLPEGDGLVALRVSGSGDTTELFPRIGAMAIGLYEGTYGRNHWQLGPNNGTFFEFLKHIDMAVVSSFATDFSNNDIHADFLAVKAVNPSLKLAHYTWDFSFPRYNTAGGNQFETDVLRVLSNNHWLATTNGSNYVLELENGNPAYTVYVYPPFPGGTTGTSGAGVGETASTFIAKWQKGVLDLNSTGKAPNSNMGVNFMDVYDATFYDDLQANLRSGYSQQEYADHHGGWPADVAQGDINVKVNDTLSSGCRDLLAQTRAITGKMAWNNGTSWTGNFGTIDWYTNPPRLSGASDGTYAERIDISCRGGNWIGAPSSFKCFNDQTHGPYMLASFNTIMADGRQALMDVNGYTGQYSPPGEGSMYWFAAYLCFASKRGGCVHMSRPGYGYQEGYAGPIGGFENYKPDDFVWHPEFSVNRATGIPYTYPNVDAGRHYLGKARTESQHSSPQADGTYMREFDYGFARWNPEGNPARHVTYPIDVRIVGPGTLVPAGQSILIGSMRGHVVVKVFNG